MDTRKRSDVTAQRYLRYALGIGLVAFAGAATLVIGGRRGLFNWVLLGGTFGNLVITRSLLKSSSRVG